MTSMLLIISFLLHIITLFAVYQLFKELQSSKRNQGTDIENLFAVYLEEFKEENRKLQDALKQPGERSPVQKDAPQPAVPFEQILKTAEQAASPADVLDEQDESAIKQVEDQFEASLQSQILLLHKQGKNIEEIARQLGCGKTEAELVIKMQKNRI